MCSLTRPRLFFMVRFDRRYLTSCLPPPGGGIGCAAAVIMAPLKSADTRATARLAVGDPEDDGTGFSISLNFLHKGNGAAGFLKSSFVLCVFGKCSLTFFAASDRLQISRICRRTDPNTHFGQASYACSPKRSTPRRFPQCRYTPEAIEKIFVRNVER